MADEKKNTDRKKALESAILQIEKQFGKGAIMKYGEGAALKNIEVIPTGCLALDIALGIGGIPKGRIIEIYGPESSGKTTVSLHIIAELQKQGGIGRVHRCGACARPRLRGKSRRGFGQFICVTA